MPNALSAWLRAILCVVLIFGGCSSALSSDFPNRVVGANGQTIILDDLEAIANDANLSNDEKRQQFRDLGIEDEKLIDALLTL